MMFIFSYIGYINKQNYRNLSEENHNAYMKNQTPYCLENAQEVLFKTNWRNSSFKSTARRAILPMKLWPYCRADWSESCFKG